MRGRLTAFIPIAPHIKFKFVLTYERVQVITYKLNKGYSCPHKLGQV
jgi:hypothetical protein